jgi:hypothetical protein
VIEEGKMSKGGINERPTSKRPSPPKGQSITKMGHLDVSDTKYKISKRYIKLSHPIPMECDTINGPWVECKELK